VSVDSRKIEFETKGEVDLINITDKVADELSKSSINSGIVNIHVPGATGIITTIEYEPGLVSDFPEALERLFPKNIHYKHHDVWDDGNGHSHVRATMIGPSLTVPFNNKKMILGKWQQIIFGELDVKHRSRTVIVQIIGN